MVFLMIRPPPRSTLLRYTTLFRSTTRVSLTSEGCRVCAAGPRARVAPNARHAGPTTSSQAGGTEEHAGIPEAQTRQPRSEEHTSELHHANISYAVFCLKKNKENDV